MRIESFFPGRLRVRSSLFTSQANLDKVNELVASREGIKEVASNRRTGSLTITYDPELITTPMLLEAKAEIEKLEAEMG